MITNKKFICTNCQTEEYNDIIFLAVPEWNKDFQYKCQHCGSIHIFHHNESYDLVNNMHLYVGTIDKNLNWVVTNSERGRSNQHVLDFYLKTLYDMQNQKLEISKFVTKNKISNKPYNKQPIMIFNSIVNYHFQECFRGIVRLKEHLLNTDSEQYYNILIMNNVTKICASPLSKLEGLDEIWFVSNVDNYTLLSQEITEMLSAYDSNATCISKKAGPTKYGVNLIKNLLKLNDKNKKLLKSNKDQIQNKYIAITVRNDYIKERAGFDDEKEISKVGSMIKERGFVPIVVACTENEFRICETIDSEVLLIKSLEDQIAFYSEHCYGMVGTNGSCCNIPSLYNIPMFILARDRQFPDDFYCFGRLISPYKENHFYHGELWKADNVWEYPIGMEEKTSIDKYKNEFYDWLYYIGKNTIELNAIMKEELQNMDTTRSCEPYATIASDPTEKYMKDYNPFLSEKTKSETITLTELEAECGTYTDESMKFWLPVYIHEQDRPPYHQYRFQFSDSEAFKQYITDSQWFPDQSVNTLKTRLKFLCREPVYAAIKNAIGDNWQEKTILEFAAGKCIHSWLLGDLFKQVISVELQAKEICTGLKINQILGIKPNVSFYIGDITTCCDELIEKYKPDFLLFQMGMGFFHIIDENRQTPENTKWDAVSKDGNELAKKIAAKHNLPYWYN